MLFAFGGVVEGVVHVGRGGRGMGCALAGVVVGPLCDDGRILGNVELHMLLERGFVVDVVVVGVHGVERLAVAYLHLHHGTRGAVLVHVSHVEGVVHAVLGILVAERTVGYDVARGEAVEVVVGVGVVVGVLSPVGAVEGGVHSALYGSRADEAVGIRHGGVVALESVPRSVVHGVAHEVRLAVGDVEFPSEHLPREGFGGDAACAVGAGLHDGVVGNGAGGSLKGDFRHEAFHEHFGGRFRLGFFQRGVEGVGGVGEGDVGYARGFVGASLHGGEGSIHHDDALGGGLLHVGVEGEGLHLFERMAFEVELLAGAEGEHGGAVVVGDVDVAVVVEHDGGVYAVTRDVFGYVFFYRNDAGDLVGIVGIDFCVGVEVVSRVEHGFLFGVSGKEEKFGSVHLEFFVLTVDERVVEGTRAALRGHVDRQLEVAASRQGRGVAVADGFLVA